MWLAGFAEVGKEEIHIQHNISDFLTELLDMCSPDYDNIVWFHNLKFDGSFLLNYLLRNNIPCDYFINDMGVWYSISLELDDVSITFRDSFKIIPMALAQISKVLHLETIKGDTPLLFEKPDVVLDEWIDYIERDVKILSLGVEELYVNRRSTKFTTGGESLKLYKKTVNFKKLFPTLDDDIDTICREAYRGGYVMVNQRFKEKVINEPLWVFDVNSEHPANMNYQLMPYGEPKVVSGYVKPKTDSELAIYHGVVKFEVKKGALPCLQFRDSLALVGLGIRKTDYPMSTKGEYYPITLTNIDLEMLERVAYYDFKAETTLLFKAKKGMFSDYLSSLFYAKEHAETLGERTDAKLKMNALYGKFGTKTEQAHKIVNIDENGVLDLSQKETEYVKPIYVPVAVFTTVYGRRQVLTGAMDNIERFLYTDTDSLHFLKGDGTMPDLDIDPKKIGAWKLEDEFNQAKYLRPKLYMEQLVENGEIVKKEVKGAGMTKEVKQQITLDNFVIGSKFDGKKQFKQTVGGAVIVETQFTIKENLF